MIGRMAAAAAAFLALGGMQAPPQPQAPGELALWRLDCGEFVIKQYGAFFSDTFQYPPGPKRIVDSCYLIRNGDRYMLWDAGLPGELAGQTVDMPAQTMTLNERIVDQLAPIGVRPEQIEFLGISHYHLDHIGQAADFPNATLVIGKGDVEVLRTQTGDFIQPDRLRPWLDGERRMVEAQSDIDLFHDGRVVMLSMPGHTPNHFALLVRLASGPVLLSGDLYHFTEQVENRGVPPFNHNRADTLASMDRFDRIARNLGARTIIQHEPADVAKLPAFPEAAR
ncbi:MAG: N-acyl homoserine lactonase family protein [Allosphingosinicella sp.]|uniref:N-acyl homoserine lactonase family protein n=1 Tax=Allosphingosinicella sp. TaxID=2823234 RepID=UPI00392AFAB7